MKIRTENSVYEIEIGRRRFRRVEGRQSAAAPPLSVWQRLGQIGPVRVGEPLRIYWLKNRDGEAVHLGLWTTAQVVEIIDAGVGDEHVDVTSMPLPEQPATDDAPGADG